MGSVKMRAVPSRLICKACRLSSALSLIHCKTQMPFPPECRCAMSQASAAGPAAIRTGQPEWPAQLADFFEVNDIARPYIGSPMR